MQWGFQKGGGWCTFSNCRPVLERETGVAVVDLLLSRPILCQLRCSDYWRHCIHRLFGGPELGSGRVPAVQIRPIRGEAWG